MTEYDIGGGKKIQIPDNLDAETRLKLAEVIKDEYGIDINQTSALEQAKEFGKAIPRGIASLALDVPTGIVGLFDIGNDSNLYKGLEGLQDRLRQDSVLAADPRYADKFSTKLGEGVGSFVPFLGAGMVGRALAKAPGAAKGFLSPTFTAPTALAIPTGIAAQGDRLQMARDMGEDVGGLTETTAELFGGLIGITEVLPVASILGKVSKSAPKNTKERLVSALQSGAFEGGQEVAASILQDLTARGLYSEDLPMADSMFEEFTIGGIIGSAADLVVTSMAGKQSARRKQLEEDELRSEENKQRLILQKKQDQAVEQGVLEEMQDIPSVTVPQIIAPEELGAEPSVEVIVTPQEQFAVVDISNPEAPVQIDIKDKEIDAIKVRDKITQDFNNKKLKSKLDNDTYNLGLINSSTAYEIGQSLEDSRASDVTISQLINSVPKNSKQEVTLRGLVNSFVAQNPGKTSRSYPRLSMAEAKQLLTAKQFNEFTSAYAQGVFKASEKKGEPSIIADKDTIDISAKYVKEIAASKNIDLNFQSPAVQYAAEKYTGTPEFNKMKKGQKELFLAKLHALPKFNSRTTFPDFRPRNYTAQEMADFVANAKSNNIIFDKNTLLKVGPDSIRKNEVATKQFIDDLIYSGRAEQVEGTNNYKIRDNFEFDIARKAEGFNETPEEFGARLTAEGKLPAESIAELVEQERTKQERLLPPVEIEPKTINYAETLQEGKVNKFAKEFRKRLNAVGLRETGIVVSDDILSTTTLRRVDGEIKFDPRGIRGSVEGQYDKNTDTIFLSLNAVNPDGGATEVEIEERLKKVLDHEMIHAFRAKDLINKSEYSYLTKMTKTTKFPNDPKNRTFYNEAVERTKRERQGRSAAIQEDLIVEEAIAELFRNKDLLVNTPPKVDGIFNKIIQFFKTAGQAMRSSGYKSATEIFNNIESGRVGARERGVVRTTRLVDAGRIPASFLTTEEPDQPAEEQRIIPGDEIRQTLRPRGIRPTAIPKPKPAPPVPPAPTGPTTPPTTPTTIYNSRTLSNAQYNSEREKIIKGLQDAKILDKDVFDKDGNVTKTIKGNNDSVKMMKWLIDNSPSQDYKIIAQKVHKSLLALKKQGRSFPLNFKVGDTNGLTGRIRGQINPRGKEDKFGQPFTYSMSLNDDGKGYSLIPLASDQAYKDWKLKNGVNFETILHESIHQATLAQIYAASGSPSILAKLSPDGGSKALEAQKELRSQANRIKNHYRSKMRFYEDLSDKILQDVSTGDQTNLEIYKENYAKAPAIEKEIADIYIREYSDGIITRTETGLRKARKRNFENYRIKYQLYSDQSQKRGDVSELLTFGLTNREFQEMLESIPFGKDATGNLWNKFVETIRKLLAVPAKLNTELSAFLKNASTVLDLQTTGINLDTRDVRDVPLFSRPPRDESSGHVADGVPAQYGPPAHDLNVKPSQEEFTPEGYSTFGVNVDYDRLQDFSTQRGNLATINRIIDSAPTREEGLKIIKENPDYQNMLLGLAEEVDFLRKLQEIKGNPNAEITMYQAAPQRDLREGDLITPFLSEAEALVEDSKVTREEIREADRARRRQEQIDKTGAIDLQQEKLYNQMDGIMDIFGMPERTPSKVHTFKLRAGDVRWDGNNGWARWGYFPRIKAVEDIPTFSRAQSRFPTTQEEINVASQQLLEDSLSYHSNLVYKTERELFQDVLRPDERITLERRRYNAEAVVAKTERRLEELRTGTGQLPLFSRTNLVPDDSEVPFDWASRNRFDTFSILDQLKTSREDGGNRDNPPPLKMAIVEAFKGRNNRPLLKASKKFLEKFTNKKGNLVLFRALNIPEGEKIKNYGQLPEDLFASTTLNSREALAIGRNLFNRSQRRGEAWNPEILRYEVPMSKVKGYIPMLLKAMRPDYIDILEDGYAGSGIYKRDDLEQLQEEFDESYYRIEDLKRELEATESDISREELEKEIDRLEIEFEKEFRDFLYPGSEPNRTESQEDLLEDEMYNYDRYIQEAEVLADLRGIKPTYQYSPELENRKVALITDVPLFSRKRRDDTGTNSQENIQLREALAEAEETVKQTPRGSIPYYNLNASDTALKAAIDFNKDLSATAPDDIPKFSRPTLDNIDPNIAEAAERLGGEHRPDVSWGARTIEAVKDPVTSISNVFKNFRTNFVDKLDAVEKKIMQAKEDNEDVRLANNTADTATMAALRLADRARGLFAGLLTRGYVTDVIDGQAALANIKDLELENGETGGLVQILAPLYGNPDVNLEQVFKLYATLKRAKTFDETGKEIDTPVRPEDFALIEQIEQQHPEVVEVYNNYQRWNNRLIEFAENKGLLDPEQAQMWRTHSSYYPFYKQMIDDADIQGPRIAGGSLPNNPLSIKITGSEKPIDADPIEAISRNSLSILTAALKNDGTAKLLRDLQSIGEARKVSAKQAGRLNTIFVFEDGIKQYYQLDDVNLFHGIQAIGGTSVGPIAQALAMPAGLLRDTVTRDPGFVVVNILRDTLSSAVTSGAPYTPFVDSVKNMFGEMENLEKFGVLGGYDFANDEGSVKQFITRTMRQKGLTPNNGMSASGAFFKLWDGLGALTTKSDGATRMAVYDAVYKKLKNEGYTEAQAQSEAAFQGLEIINFGRRGLDTNFRIVTAAIPFLNARIQGLDVLYRGFTGQYSSVEKLGEGETLKDVQSRIMRRALLNGGLLSGLTLLYYLMVHDTDEYKNLKREVRDDNWVIPIGSGNAVKIPIPFEVGMLFKAIPERVFDMTLGDDAFTRKSADEALTSITRQLGTSANIPFFQPGAGLQLIKPIAEVRANRNSFTDTEIVPYYQQQKEPALQARATTNEFARIMGEFLNVSPAKIEHIMRGYTGTLGGYVLAVVDTITRGATGSPLLPSNFELNKLPVINRLLLDLDKSGGYQQQFYELRGEVDRAVATINSLQKQQRFDELSAYRSNMQGVLNVKGQVRAIERYLDNWRKRRDRLMRDENISVSVKSDMLRELELERDMRLAMVPELRKRANIPVLSLNL